MVRDMRPVLRIKDGSREFTVDVRKDELTFGRDPKVAEIVVRDQLISRKHFALRKKNGSFYVVDLESRNGTFVNGQRVTECEIKFGDVIKVGETTITFSDKDEPKTSSEAVEKPNVAVVGFEVTDLSLDGVKKPRPDHLSALMDVTLTLGPIPKRSMAAEALLPILLRRFNAARAGVYFLDKKGEVVSQHTKVSDVGVDMKIELEPEIVKMVLETKKAVLRSADVSFAYIPVVRDHQIVAMLYVDTIDGRSRLTEDDLLVLSGIGILFESLSDGK